MITTNEIIKGEHVFKDITVSDLEQLFKACNEMYFGDRLPQCELKKMSRSFGGDHTWGHFTDHYDGTYSIEINLNPNIMWTPSALRNVMVHEMIHYDNQLCYGFTGAIHHLPPFITSMLWMNLRHKELRIRCSWSMPLRRKPNRKDDVKLKLWEWPLGILLQIVLHLSGLFIVPYTLCQRMMGKSKSKEPLRKRRHNTKKLLLLLI